MTNDDDEENNRKKPKKKKEVEKGRKQSDKGTDLVTKRSKRKRDADEKENKAEKEVYENDRKQGDEVKQSDKEKDRKKSKREVADSGATSVEKVKKKEVLDKKENEAEKEEKPDKVHKQDQKQSDEVKQSDKGKDHVTKPNKNKREVADSGATSVEKVKKNKVLDKKENEAEKEEKPDEVHKNDRSDDRVMSDEVKQSDEVKDNVTKKSKKEVGDNGVKKVLDADKKEVADNGDNGVKVLDADKKENEAEKEEKPDEVNVVEMVIEENSEDDFERSDKKPLRKSTRIAEGRAVRKLMVDKLVKSRCKSKQERKKLVKPFICDEAPETNRIPTGYYGPHTGENTPTIRQEPVEVTREEFWTESSESEKNVDDRHVFNKKNRVESDDDTDGEFVIGDETFRANINTIVSSLSDSEDLDMSLLNTTPPESKRTIGIGCKKIRKTADGCVEYDTELNKQLETFEKDAKNIRNQAGIYSDDSDDEEDECVETKNDGTDNENGVSNNEKQKN